MNLNNILTNQQICKTEAEWNGLNYIPAFGEIVIYNKDSEHPYKRFKIGDGSSPVKDLDFSSNIIKQDDDNNNITFGEGKINSKYSIAGGTNDKEVLENVIGKLNTIIGSELPLAEANGDLSLSYGAGTITNSVGSVAIGVENVAGCKGFYWFSVSDNTLTLSTKQPSLLTWKASWDSTAKSQLDKWAVGDIISIVNNSKYVLCSKITAITNTDSSASIEVDALPFTSMANVTLTKFDDFSIINPSTPNNGVIELGMVAIALGVQNKAIGSLSMATGWNNTVAGDYGFATGNENTSGMSAFASGYHNEALGNRSSAQGHRSIAKGQNSHASGYGVITPALDEITEATWDTSKNFNAAIGNNSFVHGKNNIATNEASVAFGNANKVTGQYAGAFGHENKVSGAQSFAIGHTNQVERHKSIALGLGNKLNTGGKEGRIVVGRYNNDTNSPMFSVGIGTSDTERKNGIEVDKDGNLNVIGKLTSNTIAPGTGNNSIILNDIINNKANGINSHAQGFNTQANGDESHAEGGYTQANGNWSHAEGYSTQADGDHSHAEGHYTKANGLNSHAEGSGTQANGDQSHAQGYNSIAQGQNSHASGYGDTNPTTINIANWDTNKNFNAAIGNNSFVHGKNNLVTNDVSVAFGNANKVTGQYSVAFGHENTVAGAQTFAAGHTNEVARHKSVALGLGNKLEIGGYEGRVAVGRYNNDINSPIFAVGIGTSDTNRKNGIEVYDNGNLHVKNNYNGGNNNDRETAGNQFSLMHGKDNRLLNCTASIALGLANKIQDSGYNFAAGNNNFITATNAIALGMNNRVEGQSAIALGQNNKVTGKGSYSMGDGNIVEYSGGAPGSNGAFGYKNQVTGAQAFAMGHTNKVHHHKAIALGHNNIIPASGKNTNYDDEYINTNGLQIQIYEGRTAVGRYNNYSINFNDTLDWQKYLKPTFDSMDQQILPERIEDSTMFEVGIGYDTGHGTVENPSIMRRTGFRVDATGKIYSILGHSTSGADYAEYYEWFDGNINNEDRRGYFVTFENNKIRKANSKDTYILGIISSNPAVIGNSYDEEWHNKYMTDIFGSIIYEEVIIPAEIKNINGEEIIITPEVVETHPVLNPNYNANKRYASRSKRKEWSPVGTHGQLIVIDDGTCEINGYCKVTDEGTATIAETQTDYRVIERLDETHIKIVLK